jgi:cytoskeleton protein RodZ
LESLGDFLRAERESQNVSLEDISKKTRININILRSLENDEKSNLPSDTFIKGFLKAYAKCLDLNETEILLRYKHFYKTEEKPGEGYQREIIEDFFEKKTKKPVFYIILLLITISLAYTTFMLEKGPIIDSPVLIEKEETKPEDVEDKDTLIDQQKVSEKASLEKEDEKKEPEINKELLIEQEKVEETVSTKEDTQEQKNIIQIQPEEEVHKMVLRADDVVWILITIDDEDPFEVTLMPEEVYILTAIQQFKIKIGNAGKLRVEFDGKNLGYLGEEKQVRIVTLPVPSE